MLAAQTMPPVANSTQPPTPKETITLNPFEVTADANDTYEATNSKSVTGTNLPLNKTPLDAQIYNRSLMDELGVVDLSEMLSTIGGLGPPIIGGGTEDSGGILEGGRTDPKSMAGRGLITSNPRRDGFLRSDSSLMDSFDTERVEVVQGSNSLLFGSGDAGGQVVIGSKRAYLARKTVSFTVTGDSEGTRRYTIDANVGVEKLGVRVNAVKSATRFFRPILGQDAEGLQVAATFRPWQKLLFYGEFRHFYRSSTVAFGATVRAPTSLLLPTGEQANGKSTRYIVAVPGGSAALGNFLTLENAESTLGVFNTQSYTNVSKAITMEAQITQDLAVQLRYSHDARVNHPLSTGNAILYHPDSPVNLYTDAAGNLRREWAINVLMREQTVTPDGSRGYRFTVAYKKDLQRWGNHQLNAFKQDAFTWRNNEWWNFYELDASGNVIQDPAKIADADAGRIEMPAIWMAPFPTSLIGGVKRESDIVHVGGKTYKLQPRYYPGAVPPTPANPLGLSGPLNALGASTSSFRHDDLNERSWGASAFSEWWSGRINTMVGYRAETAEMMRLATGLYQGPFDYNSVTTGVVFDTPVKGLRGYVNYATNAKLDFNLNTDVYNNVLPAGKGVSREAGLKFGLWKNRLSGNVSYYEARQTNFSAPLAGLRNFIDPPGINDRHGGNAYNFSKNSHGYGVTLSARPIKAWEIRFQLSAADGKERSTTELPTFYNDEFNTTTVNGQPVVAVKSAVDGSIAPFLVPSDPAIEGSPLVPLSLAMMKDANSPYFAVLDDEAGWIRNARDLGLDTPGIGTGQNGLPITDHQLGFTPPGGGVVIVRKAGEPTVGYSEHAFSLINRYQFNEGRLRGLIVGHIANYQRGFRGYAYTDAADGNKRKTFFYPDRFLNNVFVKYGFKIRQRIPAYVQVNVSNLFDENEVVYLVRNVNGTLAYATFLNPPRKLSLTVGVTY
ncbi:MAG: TonB-dependent receptor plug domain-containing protein [Opitutaceae bacterium]|nr:TonB-dependent receptor plug domain-containing protein [Opitutaceae bacterium]